MKHGAHVQTRTSTDRLPMIAGLIISFLIMTLFVLGTSRAAWTATTQAGGSSLSVGALSLTDDATSTLMTVTGLMPGDSASQCITVTYDSILDPNTVKLYSSSLTDISGLSVWVDVEIEEGTGGSYGSCGAFNPTSTIYSGTLAVWALKTSYATGAGVWDPTGGTASKTYKFTVMLDANTPSTFQSTTVTGIEFTWETQA